MSHPAKLVRDALEYFDRNNEKSIEKFKHVRYVTFKLSQNDSDRNEISFLDKKYNLIFKSKYETLGIYINPTNTWVWAWAIPSYKKNEITISKKMVNYGIDLDPDFQFLKTELITSRFFINDPIQLDIHVSIASYLTKQPYIFKYNSLKNVTDVADESHLSNDELLTNIKDDSPSFYTYFLCLLDNLDS